MKKIFAILICLLFIPICSMSLADGDFDIQGTTLMEYKGNAEVVTVPDGIETIHEYAFMQKDGIKKIVLPSSLYYNLLWLRRRLLSDSIYTKLPLFM